MTGLGGFIDSAAAPTTVPAGFTTPASSIYTTTESLQMLSARLH